MKSILIWNKIKNFLLKQRKIHIKNSIFEMKIEYNLNRVLLPVLLVLEAILLGLITGRCLYN